jgi:dihydroxy-acid dehydratase
MSGGPMLNGRFRGRELGSGTDIFHFDEEYRTGRLGREEYDAAEAAMSRSAGSCMTMGTASTMASLGEALGIALSTNAAIPAADSRRLALCERAGQRIVELVRSDLRMSKILTRKAFENAIIVNGAIGGSTNAVVHLLALAGRVGVPLSLDDWDRLGRNVPTLADLKPSGRFLMEEFYYVGGLPALMARISDLLHLDAETVDGKPLGAILEGAKCYNDEVIRPRSKPLTEHGGIVVLRGNLAPDGAILKPSAASPALMQHRGRAVVFADAEEFKKRIDDPALEVDALPFFCGAD